MADSFVDGGVLSGEQRMLAIEGTWWGGGISESLGRREGGRHCRTNGSAHLAQILVADFTEQTGLKQVREPEVLRSDNHQSLGQRRFFNLGQMDVMWDLFGNRDR